MLDTYCFLGNAPGTARLLCCTAPDGDLAAAEWSELLPWTALRPDTRHRFRIGPDRSRLATHVRLEIHPDGGMAALAWTCSATFSSGL